jgi:hypothetical protein
VINRIIVTGDFLRPVDLAPQTGSSSDLDPFRPSQTENVVWFHRLLQRKLAEATGLPVEMKAWNRGIDTPRFYDMMGFGRDTEGWVGAFSTQEFNAETLFFIEKVFDRSLVVAFEMADSFKHALTHLGIPFVDVNLHPIRFLPDVFFAVQTNSLGIFEAMRRFHMPAAEYYDWADLLSAAAVKLPRVTVAPNSTLLIGQTNVDRSLIFDGQLRNLADYAPVLLPLLGPDGTVLFKPHPYNPTGFGLFESGMPFGAVSWTGANIYALLPHEHLDHVIGVSSSVLAEAPYFGKRVTVLAALPFNIPDTADEARPGQHLSIYDACFDVDFWREVLSPVVPTTAATGHRFRRPPNTLRLSLRNFWGFNEVSTDFLVQVYEAGRARK